MFSHPILREPSNADNELLQVSIAVDHHLLEELLEALSNAPFPVNPQIIHRLQLTKVEFPAYSSQLQIVRDLIGAAGLSNAGVEVTSMMTTIVSAP